MHAGSSGVAGERRWRPDARTAQSPIVDCDAVARSIRRWASMSSMPAFLVMGGTAVAGIRAASRQDAGRVTGGERKVSTGQRKEKPGVDQEEPDRPRCSAEIDSDRVAITNTDTGGWLSTGRNLNRPPGRCRTGCQLLPGEAGAIGVERVGACGVSLGDGLRPHLAVRGWWSHRPALSSHHV